MPDEWEWQLHGKPGITCHNKQFMTGQSLLMPVGATSKKDAILVLDYHIDVNSPAAKIIQAAPKLLMALSEILGVDICTARDICMDEVICRAGLWLTESKQILTNPYVEMS